MVRSVIFNSHVTVWIIIRLIYYVTDALAYREALLSYFVKSNVSSLLERCVFTWQITRKFFIGIRMGTRIWSPLVVNSQNGIALC